jgi:hypothetical protein
MLALSLLTGCGGDGGSGSASTTAPPATTTTTSSTSTTTSTTTTEAPEDNVLVNKVGDAVEYGSFNGAPIQWQALAVDTENNKALLVTTEIIAYWVFYGQDEQATWETSTVRAWLNSDFFNAAFNAQQKEILLESDVANPANAGIGGNANTQDWVFLLSLDEVSALFPSDAARAAKFNASPSQIEALARAISDAGNNDNWASKQTYDQVLADLTSFNGTTDKWWLRTSGGDQDRAECVSYDGSLGSSSLVKQLQGVRPAIWVDITPK